MQNRFFKWFLWIFLAIIWTLVGTRMWDAYSAITPPTKKEKKNPLTLASTSMDKTLFKKFANYPAPFQDLSKRRQKLRSKPIQNLRSPKKQPPKEIKINFKYLGLIRAGKKEMALIDLGNKQFFKNGGHFLW